MGIVKRFVSTLLVALEVIVAPMVAQDSLPPEPDLGLQATDSCGRPRLAGWCIG